MSGARLGNPSGTHVLIIGAGITGVLIAQGLKKAGIAYTIFDSEHPGTNRPREWTMALHWSMPLVQKLLPSDLYSRMPEATADPFHNGDPNEAIPIFNSATGDLLKSIPVSGIKRVTRRKMRALCSQGIDVLWGKTLVGTQVEGDGVAAYFADGSHYRGSTLIGADGPTSKVRELLIGEEPSRNTTLGIVFNTLVVKYGDAEKARHVRSADKLTCLGYHPNGIFSFISIHDVPDPEKPEDWSFHIVCSWLGERDASLSSEERLASIKKRAEVLAEPFRSSLLWIPEGTATYNDRMSYWITIPWDNHKGMITLAGDAAHPLPPFRGQGANHSICDASNLVDAIVKIHAGEGSREDEITGYDKEAIKRGAEEVRLSLDSAQNVHVWENLMASPMMQHGLTKMS